MLTIDGLKALGADTEEGLARCMGKEDFYLRLVKIMASEENFDRLADAVAQNDLKAGFEAAHALKGALGGLSLTQIYTPVCEMTELLRAGTEMDYSELLAEVLKQRELLKNLIESE